MVSTNITAADPLVRGASDSSPRVLIHAFRTYILPKKQSKYSVITISVGRNVECCHVENDSVDQEFRNGIEVPPRGCVVIGYKSTKSLKGHKIMITHDTLCGFLRYGGTEFCIFNNSGTFILKMKPFEFIRPNLLDEPDPNEGTGNQGIIGQLKIVGDVASQRATTLERLQWGTKILNGLVTAGEIASGVYPAAGVVVSCIEPLVKTLHNEAQMKAEIQELITDMSDVIVYALDVQKYSSRHQLEQEIKDLGHLAKDVKDFVEMYNSSSRTTILTASVSPDWQDRINDLKSQLSRFKQRLDRGVNIQGLQSLSRILETLQALRGELRVTYQVTKHSRGIRSEVDDWADCLESPNVLWMKGYPGSGKSTVAFQIAYDLSGCNRLGFIIDFDRTTGTDSKVVWSSFAYEIARAYPTCREEIASTLSGHTFRLENATAGEIFRRLVVEPLQKSYSKFPPDQFPVFTIDALDECGTLDGSTNRDRKGLLESIREWSQLLPSEFKLIVTSRVESDIRDAFDSIPHVPLEILTGSKVTKESTSDIRLYVQDELQNIAKDSWLGPDWPGSDVVNDLANRASGIFIWAVTALNYIKGDPVNRLRTVQSGALPVGDVYALYRQVLETSFPDDRRCKLFVKLASAVITAQIHLTPRDWALLLNTEIGLVESIHNSLNTVVGGGNVIRFHHQSFVDFLLGGDDDTSATNWSNTSPESRCPERFRVNIQDAHHTLLRASLHLMNSKLLFNICKIKSSYLPNNSLSPQHFQEAIDPAPAYACIFWHFHLQHLQPPYTIDVNLILRFLQEKSLYWVETLSGLGAMNVAVQSLEVLQRYLMGITQAENSDKETFTNMISQRFRRKMIQKSNSDEELFEHSIVPLVEDTFKFLRYFSPALTRSSAHTYISSLPFCPLSSRLNHIYASKFKNIRAVTTGRLLHRPSEEITIRGTRSFMAVVFSHDSGLIASGSSDGDVHVWDARSREMVVGPLRGHTSWVRAIAFSFDGKRVASASNDQSIRVWDVETGAMLVGPLIGHFAYLMSVTFSRNGKYIALGSRDETIRIWSTEPIGTRHDSRVLGKHENGALSVVFSSDDEYLISGSEDSKVLVWNVRTGTLVAGPLDCHPRYFCSVPFSIGSRYITTGSSDNPVRVWDMESNKAIGNPFQAHRDFDSESFGPFSRDGARLVLHSEKTTLQICNVQTGKIVAGPFQCRTEWVSVAFSHDDRSIVSSSHDGTIQVWNTEPGENIQEPVEGHTGSIIGVAMSHDGTRIASASFDKTVRIWDTYTGKMVREPLEGHDKWVLCVAFRKDGKLVVSGSSDKTIRVWDLRTGKCVVGPIRGHDDDVSTVVFSHDGLHIISGSFDRTVRIWDAHTGKLMVGPINGHADMVWSVAVSHNDKLVVSGSGDRTIRVWSAETGEMVGLPFLGHDNMVHSVVFSHDSKRIVSGSRDGTVRIWDVDTGETVGGPFRGHSDWVRSVVFSPDSRMVISGSADCTIRVWEIKTGQTVLGPLKGHGKGICSIAASSDGKHVVSGSEDGTARVWDLTQRHGPFFAR